MLLVVAVLTCTTTVLKLVFEVICQCNRMWVLWSES